MTDLKQIKLSLMSSCVFCYVIFVVYKCIYFIHVSKYGLKLFLKTIMKNVYKKLYICGHHTRILSDRTALKIKKKRCVKYKLYCSYKRLFLYFITFSVCFFLSDVTLYTYVFANILK